MIVKFSSRFYLQFHEPQMRFSLLFIFKVDCAKYHRALARKFVQDIYDQPDAQKYAVITFSFKPLIFFIVSTTTIHAVEINGR